MSTRIFGRIVVATLGLAVLASGCAGGPEDGQYGQAQQAVKPKACPAIAILCMEGYQVKQLPNCNQICVPEQQDHECVKDSDCGPIYCFTTPCEQPVCRGHNCVMPVDQGNNGGGNGGGNGQGGEPCGDGVCGAGSYCCNTSCGICAPLDGACIQIACL